MYILPLIYSSLFYGKMIQNKHWVPTAKGNKRERYSSYIPKYYTILHFPSLPLEGNNFIRIYKYIFAYDGQQSLKQSSEHFTKCAELFQGCSRQSMEHRKPDV